VIFYVSPAEHSPAIKSLGRYSTVPEQHGADIISIGANSRVGYQRKEVSDLFSSITDGRLTREILQLTNSDLLNHSVLIIEGRLDWTTDGNSTNTYTQITQSSFRSLITSIQLQDIIIHFTTDAKDTAATISSLSRYLDKPRHAALQRRVSPRSPWGRTTNKGFAIHLLQSFPGIGPELAGAIYDKLGVPLQWSVSEAELKTVKGIGADRAKALIEALRGSAAVPGDG